MQLEWLYRTRRKATPFIVHLMMVVSVSLYAVLGAVIIRELESKEIDDSSMIVKRTTGDTSMQVRVINDTIENMEKMKIILPNAGKLRHARRRHVPKGSEGELLVGHIIHSSTTIVRSQRCVLDMLKNLLKKGDCSADVLSRAVASTVDRCYGVLIERAHQSPRKRSQRSTMTGDFINPAVSTPSEEESREPWSFVDSILFCFTVITTIGYGNVAPQTFAGRLFCIFYGLIGIPLTLLAIADLGKFLSELMETAQKILTNFTRKCWKKHYLRRNILKAQKYGLQSSRNGRLKAEPLVEEFADLESAKDPKSSNEDDEKDPSDSEADTAPRQAISLLLLFLAYILIGALMITTYEPDMDYFKAIYFNFVTLTSIGLGDIVPRSETYMLFTITYIAIGLALTTIAIEIAADTLKKLHYFGRKIENVANVHIWFGGKKLTMKQLIRNLGDQFNLPVSTIKNLNLDHFVDQAIKVEAGEIPSLRPPPIDDKVFLLDTAVDYADDENEEPWIPNPTPPSNSLNDFAMEPVIRSEQSDSPATVLLDVLEKQEEAQPSVHELTPEPEQDQATTPVPEPVPEPEPELLPLLVLEHELELEPSALIVERSPTIDLPVDMNQQQQEEEAEPESLQQSELKHEPEQEPEPEPQISQQKAPSPQQDSTPDLPMDIPMHRRRDYSEEAWRRYERYQKQWQKFRQTKRSAQPVPPQDTMARRQSRQSELSTPDSESGARDESQHPISSKRQHQQRSSTQASSGEHRRRSMKS